MCKHEQGVIYDDSEQVHVCTLCAMQLPSYAEFDQFISPVKWSLMHTTSFPNAVQIHGRLPPAVNLPVDWAGHHTTPLTNTPTPQPTNTPTHPTHSQRLNCGQRMRAILDLLERVCGNNHVSRCVEEDAVLLLMSEKYGQLMNRRSITDAALCAYALYNSSLKHDAARSVQTVANWFQISESDIWKMDKKSADYSHRKLLPSDCVELARHNLKVCFSQAAIVARLADSLFPAHACSPKTLLAACFFHHFSDKTDARPAHSLRACAKACNVSPTSAGRLYKKLEIVAVKKGR